MQHDNDFTTGLSAAFAASLFPAVASMQMLGYTVEEIRRLMGKRDVLLKIFRGPNPEKEIAAWIERGGTAEVIQLDDFRTDRARGYRRDASGSSL
jgi:hypothetical protein